MSDASHNDDKDDCATTCGYALFLGAYCIATRSKEKKTIMNSNCGDELRAVHDPLPVAFHLMTVAKALGWKFASPLHVLCDNQGVCRSACGAKITEASRYLRPAYHKLRQLVAPLLARVGYIQTDRNTADLLTKAALPLARSLRHYKLMMFGAAPEDLEPDLWYL